jgi:hypothetical protein
MLSTYAKYWLWAMEDRLNTVLDMVHEKCTYLPLIFYWENVQEMVSP